MNEQMEYWGRWVVWGLIFFTVLYFGAHVVVSIL